MRAWLAGFFLNIADRLDEGVQYRDPYQDWAPISDQNVGQVSSGSVMTSGGITTGARLQANAMRLTPFIAVFASCLLVFGLVRFWQFFASKPTQSAQAVNPQDVAKKFEDAYRFKEVKREADADTGSGSEASAPAPQIGYMLAPSSQLSSPFPSGQQYTSSAPVPTSGGAARLSQVSQTATFYDPISDIIRNLTPPIDPSLETAPGNAGGDPKQDGPAWRDGINAPR